MFSPPPCKDCTGRYIGCHNDNACPAWTQWREEEKQKNDMIQNVRDTEKLFQEIRCAKDARICRQKHSARTRGYRA